ncbi:MAG: hypothetical protein WC529_07830 [Candidatus Margulisiibacteriota bacterium]
MPIRRTSDVNIWSGLLARGQRRPFHTLVNMGQGMVAFGRTEDLQNVRAHEEILQRRKLDQFAAQVILEPACFELYRPVIESVDWVALRIREEDLNATGLKLVSEELAPEEIAEITLDSINYQPSTKPPYNPLA